jgi:hypothetical protein
MMFSKRIIRFPEIGITDKPNLAIVDLGAQVIGQKHIILRFPLPTAMIIFTTAAMIAAVSRMNHELIYRARNECTKALTNPLRVTTTGMDETYESIW